MTIAFNKTIRGVYKVNTNKSPLMLRASPDSNGTVMAEMKKETKVICWGMYSGEWYNVSYQENDIIHTGYANKKYLRKDYSL